MKTFRIGGVHPAENKFSAAEPIKIAELPKIAVFPLGQHIGAPAKAIVQCEIIIEDNDYQLSLIGNATVIGQYELEYSGIQAKFSNCILTEEQVQYEKCNNFVNGKIGHVI